MNKEEAIIKLKELGYGGEFEHEKADIILCDLLESLGYSDVVELYNEIVKWYA